MRVKARMSFFLRRVIRDERGQMFPWMVFLSILITGIAGLTIDLGHAYVCYRQLQASTDAAALSGAYELAVPGATTAMVQNQIDLFASSTGGANVNPNLSGTSVNITFKCISDSDMVAAPCSAGAGGYNTVQVEQSTPVPTYFIRMLSLFRVNALSSIPMHVTSTATMASGANDQVNVAIVVDATASMNTQDTDANCGNTRIYCALQGVRYMLGLLAPCTASTSKSGETCTPYDSASLFSFPSLEANSVGSDTDCSTRTEPTIVPYSTPAAGATWSTPTGTQTTYQITNYLSDWSSNNQVGGTLSGTSTLVEAVGGPSGSCAGLDSKGGDGTYYAGVIYAAQSSLVAQQTASPGSKNIMIILSDGDANAVSGKMVTSSGSNVTHNGDTYPSLDDQCQQAISAANYASNNGTTVYTIAYGAASSGCSTDTGSYAISPCHAMMEMSTGYVSTTDAPHFYSDATASQNKGQCTAPDNPNLDLNGIFGSIAAQLTKPRLIPNTTT